MPRDFKTNTDEIPIEKLKEPPVPDPVASQDEQRFAQDSLARNKRFIRQLELLCGPRVLRLVAI